MTKEQKFHALQAKWREAADTERKCRIDLSVRYGGSIHYAKAAERKRLDQFSKAERKACDRFCKHLASISPRDWSSSVPVSWLRDRLTYADALTTEALSMVPDPAWSYTDRDMRAFAAALPAKREAA